MNRSTLFRAMFALAYLQAAGDDISGGAAASAAPDPAAGNPASTPTAAPELSAEDKAKQEAAAAVAKEELHSGIKAKFNNLVDISDTAFHFRKVTDPDTKIETKRATVNIPVPAPSVEGIIHILENGGEKQIALLMEAVRDKILEQARDIINENESINENNFPYEKLSWEFISNLPKAERRGGGIPKEMWDEFAKDYVAIMPALTGKKTEAVELAAKVFTSKFVNSKTNKPVLKLLQQQLTIYMNNTTAAEQFTPVLDWLTSKLETLINTDETNLLLNL